MINLGNNLIEVARPKVLLELKKQVGKDYLFKRINATGDEIITNCPFHKEGMENKPSFGWNASKNKCHCFSCGWSGTLQQLVSEVFGCYDDGRFGEKWLLKNFNSVEIEKRGDIIGSLERKQQQEKTNVNSVLSVLDLDKFKSAPIPQYAYDRGLTDELIKEFEIGFDEETQCLTFPVWDINGNYSFIAKRSINSKMFYLPKNIDKPVYLANKIIEGNYKSCYITESVFNCLTLWKLGKPAVALFGTGSWSQYKTLSKLPVREYILALDPDKAGEYGSDKIRKYVKGKMIKEVIYEESGKDVNDLQEKFLSLRATL